MKVGFVNISYFIHLNIIRNNQVEFFLLMIACPSFSVVSLLIFVFKFNLYRQTRKIITNDNYFNIY